MSREKSFLKTLTGLPAFWKAQQKDWRTTVIRTSLDRLGYQIVLPYLSLYIVALGATKTQLGSLTSAGMLLMGVVGPLLGGYVDRKGTKSVYLAAIVCLFCCYLFYTIAGSWTMCVAAMLMYYLGNGLADLSCSTICGGCLKSCDRAQGMLLCETLTAGLLGIVGPVIGAFLLVNIVGVEEEYAGPDDYRWLFIPAAALTVLTFIVVVKRLDGSPMGIKRGAGFGFVKETRSIFKENKHAVRYLVLGIMNKLPSAMIIPYVQVFAGEVKGAGVTTLAAMVTAAGVCSMALGYPLGVIADRIGRKKVMFVIIPCFWLSNILLILAPSPALLIVAGIFQGFYYIAVPMGAAIEREVVGPEKMGVWVGSLKLAKAVGCSLGALVAGIIYDKIGPHWVFITYLVLDAFIRIPCYISVPETLKKEG